MRQEIIKKVKELEKEIEKLPKGSIFTKKINGKTYFYRQWSERGFKHSEYIKRIDLEHIDSLINQRKRLEDEIERIYENNHLFIPSYTLQCALMHQDTMVIDLNIDIETGAIRKIGEIYHKEYLPIGTYVEDRINIKNFHEWWNSRCIPSSRSGLRDILDKLNISSPQALLTRAYALSLSDQYWIMPYVADELGYEDINFFTNPFSEDLGEIIFGHDPKDNELDLSSPDSTSAGNLKKRWKIIDGTRYLIKGGSNPFRQEPLNEVVASKVMDALEVNHVNYSLIWNDEAPYSICPDFISIKEDFIPAYQVSNVIKRNNSDSLYTHLKKCFKYLAIPGYEDYINKLIIVDFIIANEDRHLNNFGYIRDASTLKFKTFAPFFDNGSSFGFDKIDEDVTKIKEIETKPFKKDAFKQLELVNDYSFLSIDKLNKIKEIIKEEFLSTPYRYLSLDRRKAIIEATNNRIDFLIEKIK